MSSPVTELESRSGIFSVLSLMVLVAGCVAAPATTTSTTLKVDLQAEPVAVWHLNENNGSVVYDFIGGNNGYILKPKWRPGISGSALEYDGYNDCLRVPDADSLDLTSEGTVEAWVNPSRHKFSAGIVHKGGRRDFSDEAYSLQFYGSTGRVYLLLVNEDGVNVNITSDVALDIGSWHHIVGSWDPDAVVLYVDGRESVKTTNTIGRVRTVNGSLQIGCQVSEIWDKTNFHFSFEGLVDEVRLYKRRMWGEEVRQRYESQKP